MYKLGYVDESESDISYFYHNFIKQYDGVYELKDINPKDFSSLEDVVNELLILDLDILVVDYRLHEFELITYHGLDLIDAVKNVKKDFPCVILSSNEVEAIEHASDVNIIYSKPMLASSDDKAKALFELKIKQSIEHYRQKIMSAESEIQELVSLKRDLTLSEEDKLHELDEFLESNTSYQHKIPSHIKKNEHFNNIKELVKNTQSIISKL